MTSDKLAVIVPMKPLAQAKQRLRPALTDDERVALARAMLIHVLAVLDESGVGDLRILVSADSAVLSLAPDYGFAPLLEATAGYNEAVAQGISWAQSQGATTALIVPADLPQLTPEDVEDLVHLAGDAPQALVLAADAAETGTNALLMRPPDLLHPSFGLDSFCRHLALARAVGVEPVIHRHAHLASDIDWPADLWLLGKGAATWSGAPGIEGFQLSR